MATTGSEKRRGKGTQRYACGVPDKECQGAKTQVAMGIHLTHTHASAKSAFQCMKAYLAAQGFVYKGNREFDPGDGGPIRVLTKVSRYGARLRPGKAGRHMARQSIGGIITG